MLALPSIACAAPSPELGFSLETSATEKAPWSSRLTATSNAFSVEVFERTPTQLTHRGGGIVLQPITMKWFEEGHSARRIDEVSTRSSRLRAGSRPPTSSTTTSGQSGANPSCSSGVPS